MPSCWIFISYRRHETVYHSQLIFEKLDKEFGRDHVFLDTKSIQPGERFPEKISEALQSTSVLIALIEKDWLSIKNQDGQQRLFLDDDYVRLEIETALSRNIPIIPVLFDNVQMPQKQHLPDPLKSFSDFNAIEISSSRIDFDIQHLINAISTHTVSKKTTASKQTKNSNNLHLLCNRKNQARDFTVFFNNNLKNENLIQFIFFYGPSDTESDECPFNFIKRLRMKEIKAYWENKYDSLKYIINKSSISIPEKKKDLNSQRESLIQALFDAFKIIANDYTLSAFYQHPRFDKQNVIILYHEISIDEWNFKLLKWYINEHTQYSQFFCQNVKPTLLLFFYIKIEGFNEKTSFFHNPCRRCQKKIDKLFSKIDKDLQKTMLEPLQPVEQEDVRQWFSDFNLEDCTATIESEINHIFNGAPRMSMRKIESKLASFIKNRGTNIDLNAINANYK